MSAQFKTRADMVRYAWKRVEQRARRDRRFRRLVGDEAKRAVINGTVERLLRPKGNPVTRLSPALQRKMRASPGPVIGNLQLNRSPLDSAHWRAWEARYRQLIELGSLWSVPNGSAEQDKLIDRALDAERHAYVKGTSDSSPGVNAERHDLDQDKQARIGRYTEAGQQLACEPTRLLEQQEQERQEQALLDADAHVLAIQRQKRAQVEAEEDTNAGRAGVAYYRWLPWKRRKAFHLICTTDLPSSVIARRCQISPAIVSRIRTTLEGICDEHQTEPPDEIRIDSTVREPSPEIPASTVLSHEAGELATQLADAADDTDAPWSGTLHLAESLHAPEVDANDLSDPGALGYHRTYAAERLLGSRFGQGKRWFNADALSTGRDGGNPVSILQKESYASRYLTDAQLQQLERMSALQNVNIVGLLRDLDGMLKRREQQAEGDAKALALREVRQHIDAALWALDAAELAELRAWAEPFCHKLAGRSFDEVFGPYAKEAGRNAEGGESNGSPDAKK